MKRIQKLTVLFTFVILYLSFAFSPNIYSGNKKRSYNQVLSNGDAIGHCSKHNRKYRSRKVGLNRYKICIRLLPCYVVEGHNEARAIEIACSYVTEDQKVRNLKNRF